jgi:hypothetical protein
VRIHVCFGFHPARQLERPEGFRDRGAVDTGLFGALMTGPPCFGWPSAVVWPALLLACAAPRPALAQTDEIQVYNAEIAAPGTFNLTLHDNYTPEGKTTADFTGGVVSNHSLNGVPEWAYGVTDWMEAGLYFPLYTLRGDGGFQLDGFKLRTLFVVPDAARRSFFYGVNFEFSFNSKRWDANDYTSEIRPIVGWRFGKVDLIVNPILDNSYKGLSRLDFAPETRVAYNISSLWAVAAEEYDDFGPIRAFYGRQQTHQLFGVVDFNGKPLNVEFGVGFGLNSATDGVTLKLILSRDL